MLDKFENFILEYTETNNYINLYDDIFKLLNINNSNIQNLLINKDLNFNNIDYFSSKKNKLIHEFIDDNKFTSFIVYILNHIYNEKKVYDLTHNTLKVLEKKIPKIVNELKINGLSICKNTLDKNKCNIILKNLNNKKFINRNNNKKKNIDLFNNSNKNIWWLYNYNDLLNINIIQHIITSEYLLKIAEDYLECNPILHNVLFWASYPGEVETTQQFHQDYDDIKFFKIFIYLNDVNMDNGPHTYVKNSINNIERIKKKDSKLSERYNEELVNEKFKEDIINITGNTGSIIFEDTHGLHKGTNVKEGKRFVLQLVYGCSTFYYLKNNKSNKYNCNIKNHNIIYNKFLKYPYNFMNFTFSE